MNKRLTNLFAAPYIIWLVIFIIVPLFLVSYFALTTQIDGRTVFTLDNFRRFFYDQDKIYVKVFIRSVRLAGINTLICLVLGYPVAYILAKGRYSNNGIVLFLFIVPMWMNFLLRTYAWLTLLDNKNGVINVILTFLGLPTLKILYTDYAVLLGMVYNFLPFMILPIHTVLQKTDKHLIEAAQDLGADAKTVFLKVTFPLSLPGVTSGIVMVFMPAVTTFVISDLLGGKQTMLIGNLIHNQFLVVSDKHFGSAISVILIVIIIIAMVISSFADNDSEGGVLF